MTAARSSRIVASRLDARWQTSGCGSEHSSTRTDLTKQVAPVTIWAINALQNAYSSGTTALRTVNEISEQDHRIVG